MTPLEGPQRRTDAATPAGPRDVRLTVAVQTDKGPAEYAQLGRQVERWGFDGLTAFADLGYQPPLPALLHTAAATERLRLGVACWNPTLLHPVEIAGQLAALDGACCGRSYLGLTSGAWLSRIGLHATGGVNRLADAVAAVRYLLSGSRDGFDGRYFRIEPGFALQYALPRRHVDLLLGVWGPRGAALAARTADEVKLGGCANPAMVAVMRRWLDEAGTDRRVGVVAGAVTVVHPDRTVARRIARTEVAMYLDVVAGLDRTAEVPAQLIERLRARLAAGDHAGAGRLIGDDVLDLFSFAGTPDEIAGRAVELARAGATRIEFGTPHGLTGPEGVELLGRAVLPAVRHELGITDDRRATPGEEPT